MENVKSTEDPLLEYLQRSYMIEFQLSAVSTANTDEKAIRKLSKLERGRSGASIQASELISNIGNPSEITIKDFAEEIIQLTFI
jgi:hypothetical protein